MTVERKNRYELRECKHHGMVDHFKRKPRGWRCAKCNNDAVMRRRRKVKEELLKYKGQYCEVCGYDGLKCPEAMDFHHRDPTQKEFRVSQGTLSLEKQKTEVDKCALLCCRCHRELHAGIV